MMPLQTESKTFWRQLSPQPKWKKSPSTKEWTRLTIFFLRVHYFNNWTQPLMPKLALEIPIAFSVQMFYRVAMPLFDAMGLRDTTGLIALSAQAILPVHSIPPIQTMPLVQ